MFSAAYNTANVEQHHLVDFIQKAVKSAADWNKKLNQDKKEKRAAYFDMQTFNIHYPMNNKGKMKVGVVRWRSFGFLAARRLYSPFRRS